jgi:hypothetical protein
LEEAPPAEAFFAAQIPCFTAPRFYISAKKSPISYTFETHSFPRTPGRLAVRWTA